MPLPITDPGYKHNNEYFANLIKKFIPARNLTVLLNDPMGAESEYWRLVNMGTIPDSLGNFRANTPSAAVNGTSGSGAPSPIISTNSKDYAGQVTFGTGAATAIGGVVAVNFGGGAYATAPWVNLTPTNVATAALQPYILSVSTTGFVIGFGVAPAVSQANNIYACSYRIN